MALLTNHYTCERCGHNWSDDWDCAVDDDCPSCGARHMSPHTSEDNAVTCAHCGEERQDFTEQGVWLCGACNGLNPE